MSRGLYSVVLPCRNQGDHIRRVLESYAEPLTAACRPYELVVVPNACTDDTERVVRLVAAEDPRVRVVGNPRGGWGLSVRTGLAAAEGDVLCYANSARTEPASIPPLLQLYEQSAPCVAKVCRQQRNALFREAGSWLYNHEASLLFGFRIRDVNGTPKILARDVYRRLGLTSDGDLLDLELVVRARRLGIPVVELPVAGFKRHGGRSGTNLASAARMYAGALKLWRGLAREREAGTAR